MTLGEWLQRHGVGHCLGVLEANGVDVDVLQTLTEADLRELGFALGDRKRLMSAIAAHRQRLSSEAGQDPAAIPTPPTEDEVRQITLLFVDLVGSSQLSAELSLEQYRQTLQAYQNCCLDAIRKEFGYVAQFLGDGVVAYFGYPVAEENDAERAVLTALEIVRTVERIVPVRGTMLRARAGIATGDVLIGDIAGNGLRGQNFAMGEVPNLAARIQSAVQPGEVGVSGRTHRLLGRNFDWAFAGPKHFKGFRQPVDVWIARGVRRTELRFQARSSGALSPLLGRQDEYELLESRWEEARQGKGQVVLISGEAGVGKSRLVEALKEQASAHPSAMLGLQCSPYHQNSAFNPLITHLSHAAGVSQPDDHDGNLAQIRLFADQIAPDDPEFAGALASLLGVDLPDNGHGLSPDETKERTMSALLTYLRRVASGRPELLLFEDLHWVDASSEELLDRLVERISGDPILLVCTYRLDYTPRWTDRASVAVLTVSRLDDQNAELLLRHIFADEAVSGELVRTIISRAEGVPLFLEEMARMVLDRRRRAAAGEESVTEHELPATLKDLLRAQIDHLPTARDIVPVCAALGRSFSLDLVSTVYGYDERTTRALLDQLGEAQVLTSESDGKSQIWAFRHALIQEAAYEAMLPSRSRALHQRIAEAYLTSFADAAQRSPEIVAQHLWRAGKAAEARNHWHLAAANALRQSAGHEAIAHLEAAIRANETIEDEEEREREEIALRKTLSVAIDTRAFGSPESLQNLARLGEVLRRSGGGAADVFLALHMQFGAQLMSGDSESARALCPDMEALARSSGDPTMSALSEHNRGMVSFMLGQLGEAVEHLDRAVVLRQECNPEEILRFHAADIRVVDLSMRCWATALSEGDSPMLREALQEAIKATEAEEHEFSRCFGLNILAAAHQVLDDFGAVLDLVGAALAISGQKQFAYWNTWSAILRGWAWARSGDAGRGIPELRNGLDAYLATGSTQIEPYAKTLLADAYLNAGEIERGLAEINDIRRKQDAIAVRYQAAVTDRVERDLVRAKRSAR